METAVPGKQKKRKREEEISFKQQGAADSLTAADATTLASHVSERKQKKRRKKKRHLAAEEDPAARHGPQQHAPHVGVDRTNSNWKQLQAVGPSPRPGWQSSLEFRWIPNGTAVRYLGCQVGDGGSRHCCRAADFPASLEYQEEALALEHNLTLTSWACCGQSGAIGDDVTLKKGQTARKNQSMIHKEQGVGADVTEPGKFRTKRAEDATQRQLETLSPRNEDCSLTKVLAMDCEMVGAGLDGKRSILARVSLVNMWGNVVYDKHIRPMEQVTDYRTKISGVRASNLRKGEDFAVVQKEVAELILGRVLVGHSLRNDLKIMYLSHPKKDIRDTAAYPPLRNTNGRPQALRHIAEELLGVKIQVGEHCSVQDARAAMYIYQHLKRDWERTRSKRR